MRESNKIGSLRCFKCGEEYFFPLGQGIHYFYSLDKVSPDEEQESYNRLIKVITKPILCYECGGASAAEDIPSFKEFEVSLTSVKRGAKIEQPIHNEFLDIETSVGMFERYINWRLNRKSCEKCLFCGASNYLAIDSDELLLIHETCEDGVLCQRPLVRGSYCGEVRGRVYSSEGEFILEGSALSWDRVVRRNG